MDEKLLSQLDISGGGLFDNPHYLLLNLAMGGTLGGNIPNSFVQDTWKWIMSVIIAKELD